MPLGLEAEDPLLFKMARSGHWTREVVAMSLLTFV